MGEKGTVCESEGRVGLKNLFKRRGASVSVEVKNPVRTPRLTILEEKLVPMAPSP